MNTRQFYILLILEIAILGVSLFSAFTNVNNYISKVQTNQSNKSNVKIYDEEFTVKQRSYGYLETFTNELGEVEVIYHKNNYCFK